MNGEWIRRLTLPELEAAALPLAVPRYGQDVDRALLQAALELGQERATTLGALLDQADFLFVVEDDFRVAPDSWDKLTRIERVGEILDAVAAHLSTCDWEPAAIDPRAVVTDLGIKPRDGLRAIYTAVEGRHAGLPLFDAIYLLGRDRALGRIRAARARLAP